MAILFSNYSVPSLSLLSRSMRNSFVSMQDVNVMSRDTVDEAASCRDSFIGSDIAHSIDHSLSVSELR